MLKYYPGKGLWTYHLRIPNSMNIEGKWGKIKVSGLIDNYKIEAKNLAPIKGENKILSINSEIRKAINKKGGEMVCVTLYLLKPNETISEIEILETFNESKVLEAFNKLKAIEKKEIIESIISQKNEVKQVLLLNQIIDKFNLPKS